jgi:hypothetical protein
MALLSGRRPCILEFAWEYTILQLPMVGSTDTKTDTTMIMKL